MTGGYRADIDGLRAVAVLAVIGFHAAPAWAAGGYVGVDVFFVISGYLISSVILGGLEQERFTFSGFYARRIRRIFPALIVLLGACYVWGWFVLQADDYGLFGRHMAGAAGFVANFLFWKDTWYFDPGAIRKPLLHLWSLGVEEQFYLVWPLLLYVAWRRRVNLLWPVGLVLILSYATSAYEIRHDATAAFYSPVTRIWELALGAAIACAAPLTARGWKPLSEPTKTIASFVGLGLIVAAVFSIGQTKVFLGLRGAIPTAGAALLIAAGPDAWPNRAILSRKAVVWIGLISYPLYLWHWSLLSLTAIVQARITTPGERAIVILASVLLAWLTYRLVERPIRFGRIGARMVPVLCAVLAAILVAGVATAWSDGFPNRALRLSDRQRFVQYYVRMHWHGLADAYASGCDLMDWSRYSTRPALDEDCTKPGTRGTILLWGDSYAQALSLGLRRLMPEGVHLAQVTTSACAPSEPTVSPPDNTDAQRCARSNALALDTIARLRPEAVVLAQHDKHRLTDWDALAARIRALGARRVLLVGPAPQWKPSLPLIVSTDYWGSDYQQVSVGLDREVFAEDAALKKRFEQSATVEYVSMIDRLCDAGGCLAKIPGGDREDLIAVDSGHLSPKGSIFVVDKVLGATLISR